MVPTAAPPGRGRHPELEAAIGARVRAARLAAEINQRDLGAAVGISFQQMQKYETGQDRVSASRLQAIAVALGVHPGSFFDDVPTPVGGVKIVRGALAVAIDWQRIKSPVTRKRLASLIAMVAGDGQVEPEGEG